MANNSDLSLSTADFAVKMLKELKGGDKEVFYSPASITLALAMTYAGAAGKTAAQMHSAMFSRVANADEVHKGMAHLALEVFNKSEDVKLLSANRLYVEKNYRILEDFLTTLAKHYQSDLQLVKFSTEAEAARSAINSWVAQTTNDKIKDLLPGGVLTALTRLVIVNAVYFKGDWKHKFPESNTKKQPFYVSEGKEVQVDMMFQKEKHLRYGESEELGCQVLGLPYKGDKLSFFVLLPKEKFGLKNLIGKLNGQNLLEAIQHTHDAEVEVWLPKFKMESTFSLKETLSQLGMTDMFDDNLADFSGITDSKPGLVVSAVVHKAFIELNEKGTEAAAATGVVMNLRCAPMAPRQSLKVRVDHPFLLAIYDRQDETILFLGNNNSPNA